MRREWIEILAVTIASSSYLGLPPCGGSGLKYHLHPLYVNSLKSPSMRREWIEMIPNCIRYSIALSPSMRREWIEITCVTSVL